MWQEVSMAGCSGGKNVMCQPLNSRSILVSRLRKYPPFFTITYAIILLPVWEDMSLQMLIEMGSFRESISLRETIKIDDVPFCFSLGQITSSVKPFYVVSLALVSIFVCFGWTQNEAFSN